MASAAYAKLNGMQESNVCLFGDIWLQVAYLTSFGSSNTWCNFIFFSFLRGYLLLLPLYPQEGMMRGAKFASIYTYVAAILMIGELYIVSLKISVWWLLHVTNCLLAFSTICLVHKQNRWYCYLWLDPKHISYFRENNYWEGKTRVYALVDLHASK